MPEVCGLEMISMSYVASPWHCPNREHVPFTTNSEGNAKTKGASNNNHMLFRRNETMLLANTASQSQAIQTQIDAIPVVGTASCPATIQRNGPTPKPNAAITPETKRNGMKR